VFVSSTSVDLRLHRQAVRDATVAEGFTPVMMEHFGAIAESTVRACRDFVESCDLVIALVAFRRGWVPSVDQGGDGVRSITAFEIEAARSARLPVYILLAHDSWPGNLYEEKQRVRRWIQDFRAGLNQPAAFFTPGPCRAGTAEPEPTSEFVTTVRKVLLDYRSHAELLPRRLPGLDAACEVVPFLRAALRTSSSPPTVTEIHSEYHNAIPVGWEPATAGRDADEAIRACCLDLARCPRQPGDTFPLLRFARALATRLPAEFTDLATARLKAAAEIMGETIAQPASSRPAPPAGSSHLLIQIQPTALDPGRYAVRAWLYRGGSAVCLAAGEERYAQVDLPGVLDRLRDCATSYAIDLRDLWVEFLLPRSLIAEAVDQWEVSLDLEIGQTTVGAEHPVVVRALERYSRPQPALELRKRGEGLRQAESQPARLIRDLPPPDSTPGFALRIAKADAGGVPLYTRLRDAHGVLCVVLDEPPPAPPAVSKADVLNTLLAVGLPVVVWSRGLPEVIEEFARLLGECPLGRLPSRVQQFRQSAVDGDPHHPGRHLTLLWDDPARLPPDFDPRHRLRPPL
jgi:hypothetical protein